MAVNYQKIQINGVTYIDGIDRMPEYRNIFPILPTGKRILDVGCHNGFYLIQARLDGATFAMGIDVKEGYVSRGVDVLGKIKLTNVVLKTENIFNGLIDGNFDVSLCLNVLHYFQPDLVRKVIERMVSVTNERMVFVVLRPPAGKTHGFVKTPHNQMRMGLSPIFFQEELPAWKVVSRPTAVEPKDRIMVEAWRN